MGAQQSASVPVAPPANVTSAKKAAGEVSACPVAHERKATPPTTQPAECPVQHTSKKYQNPTAYNVQYLDAIGIGQFLIVLFL